MFEAILVGRGGTSIFNIDLLQRQQVTILERGECTHTDLEASESDNVKVLKARASILISISIRFN